MHNNNNAMTDQMKELMTSNINESILDLINQLQHASPETSPSEDIGRPLTEIESFVALDGVLASLQKQLDEANDHHTSISGQFGEMDEMAMIAYETIESIQSAFDTRLIELRQKSKTDGRMGALIKKLNDKIIHQAESAKHKRFEDLQDKFRLKRKDMEDFMKNENSNRCLALGMLFFHMLFMADDENNIFSQTFNMGTRKGTYSSAFNHVIA